MANVSVEKRLQTLQQKRDAIDAEIKKVQTEKAREFRKRQHRREALLGRIMYQLIESGTSFNGGPWSESQLTAFMDQHLTTQRDRQLFGLSPLSTQSTNIASTKKNTKNKPKSSKKAAAKTAARTDSSPSKRVAELPTISDQNELMDEFNL